MNFQQRRDPAARAVAAPASPQQAIVALAETALAHHKAGRLEAAVEAYGEILRLNPTLAAVRVNRGVALKDLGRREEALADYDAAIAARPNFAEAHNNRGALLSSLGRNGEALHAYDVALALKPDYPEARNNRAVLLLDLGRADEALADCEAAIELRPTYPEAHNNRAVALLDLGRYAEALAACDIAIGLKPDYAQAHSNSSVALGRLGEFEAAIVAAETAAALDPAYPEAHCNRSSALNDVGRFEAALAAADTALRLKPDYPEACNNRGVALGAVGEFDAAGVAYDQALALRRNHPDAEHNRACLRLLRGDFAGGWPGYEQRWTITGGGKPAMGAVFPVWRGEDLNGKSILVFDEQGFGDAIQFSRLLKALAALGAQATFLVRPQLVSLLRPLEVGVRLTSEPPEGESFDYQCALMSLPLALGLTLDALPVAASYLAAEPERAARWKARLGDGGFKIGVAWQGNPTSKVDIRRSIPLAFFAPLAKIANVRLISLQKNAGVEQLAGLPDDVRIETLGDDFDAGRDAFVDTAAVMANLDLVISSDTAIAHLAGALGRPVWVALKHTPDWRWLLDRSDCPWYPTMRLFRQRARDDWASPFDDIERALRQGLADAPRTAT